VPPGAVVKWPGRISNPPLSHRAIRVQLKCLSKAGNSFLVVKAEAPTQTKIKPLLRLLRGRRNRSRMLSKIEKPDLGHRFLRMKIELQSMRLPQL
jgi:hypothetical protein